MKKIPLVIVCIFFLTSSAFSGEGTRLLHQPDINAESIAFIYAGDLWIAPVSGGEAKRLTSHPGTESYPKFSSDGRWIAFSGQYDGNTDVYIIPAAIPTGETNFLRYQRTVDFRKNSQYLRSRLRHTHPTEAALRIRPFPTRSGPGDATGADERLLSG